MPRAPSGTSPVPAPSLLEASRFWLRIGLVSFGGPAGQIALLHHELVERRRWLSEGRFLHALNYCLLLPGPEAIQLATYLGWLLHGVRGGLIAGGLFLLPSLLLLLALSGLYALWGQQPLLASLLWALKPAVLAIVIQASWRLGRRTLRQPLLAAIALGAFLGLALLRLPYPLIVAAAALTGWIGGRLRPAWFAPPGDRGAPGPAAAQPSTAAAPAATAAATTRGAPAATGATGATTMPAAPDALHGDSTPTPEHARFRPRQLAVTLLLSGLALALPLALLGAWGPWGAELAHMARFFTRVALVSFGGAYAVLPYVAQGAVERFGWLSAHQMADGLALGETTPGPLINVVTFVGFLGGWNRTGSLLAALQAGLVTAWFTFLPSFVFILAGAPLVEASRDDLRLGPPLTAISAAVVGVIASLALLLAAPSLAPHGRLDGGAVALVAAGVALLLGRGWGVLPLIGGAALVGLARLLILRLSGAPG